MNDQDALLPFSKIPEKYMSMKKSIFNENLKNLYSKFIFRVIDSNKDKKSVDYLYEILKTNKFFVYSCIPVISNQEIDINDSILCFENYCLFIESSKITSFKKIIEDNGSLFIDLNSNDKNTKEIKNEISAFCSYFQAEIKSNEFVKLTLEPIAAYTIRRYFLPTNFFKDHSFFSFEPQINETGEMNENDFIDFDSDKMIQKISEDKQKVNKPNNFTDFEEKDFIQLRQIYSSSESTFYLVIHIKSFYIFVMKIINPLSKSKAISHEIAFDKEYSHRCMTKCYGFVKENEQITGFVYEFMSNGTLIDYFSKNKDNIDESFSYMTVIRIAQAIKYLHSNSLIHRDIKPPNILVDHDNIPYLSDFNTIKKITSSTTVITSNLGSNIYTSPEQNIEETYSFPTDIYSFGQHIYFIYKKEDNSKGVNQMIELLKKEENQVPDSIQNLFEKCISFDSNDRPSINEIIDLLYNEANSFHFLEIPFLKKIIHNMNKTETIQYFKEMYHLLYIGREYESNHELQLFQILNIINNSEISRVLCSVGKFYFDGKIVQQDYCTAKKYFEIASEMNNAEAFFNLGKLYNHGCGVVVDFEKARQYYEIAVKQNHYSAMNNLANLYKDGLGVEKDIHKALEYYEIAAKHNNSFAFCNLGMLYLNGIGVEKNAYKAKEYFELAAKQNSPSGLCNLGLLYMYDLHVEKNFQKAKEYFELAAKQNDSAALCNLGILYYNGSGVEQSFKKAKECFELAAKKNEPGALNNLGELYLSGRGVDRNYEKARYYFELAAKSNFNIPKYNLGIIYKKGLGVAKDYLRAKFYFENSSSNDNSMSLFQLGKLYYHGKGVQQDYSIAKSYFEKSAEKNYDKSLYQLGLLYINGYGVEQDFNKAMKYFESSALQNNPKALYQMGILHFYCMIENYDFRKAREYFEMSSKSNLNSNFYLGIIYENGICVDRDMNKSIEYYKRCSNTKSTVYISHLVDQLSIEHQFVYNEYYYQSNNALGLIYITDKVFQNKQIAEDYLKESGLNEYPFGQNSLGLYYQFYLNQIDNAQYLFEKASKSHFAISEYNLGYIYEEKGKIDESIKHYINASNYEREQIIFRNHPIEDERLEISKSFITCYTNLKLSSYYLTKSESPMHEVNSYEFILNAIFRPLFSLIFHSTKYSYRFCFKTINKGDKFIITNLKEFIMDNPLFHNENDKIAGLHNSQNHDSFGWVIEEPKQNNICELNLIIGTDQPSNSQNSNDHKNNDFIEIKGLEEAKKEVFLQPKMQLQPEECEKCIRSCEHEDDISNFANNEKIRNIFEFMNQRNKFEVISNEERENESLLKHDRDFETMIIQKKGNQIRRYFRYPKKLSEMIIKTITENVDELNGIIEEMKTVLYEEPYKILFGRIGIDEQDSSNKESQLNEINSNFYDGIGDDL